MVGTRVWQVPGVRTFRRQRQEGKRLRSVQNFRYVRCCRYMIIFSGGYEKLFHASFSAERIEGIRPYGTAA